MASAIIFIIPPYFLQAFTQLTPWQTGFVLLSAPLGLVIFSRIAGKYMERFGPKLLMKIGLCVMFIAFVGLSFIQAHWSPYIMVSLLLLYGGGGIFQPANIASIMTSVSKEKQGTIGLCNVCYKTLQLHLVPQLPQHLWIHKAIWKQMGLFKHSDIRGTLVEDYYYLIFYVLGYRKS